MSKISDQTIKELADRYQIVVFWSGEDRVYIAVCPDFRGHSAHGSTPGEAAREGRIALELMIDGYLEHDHGLPEPRQVAA